MGQLLAFNRNLLLQLLIKGLDVGELLLRATCSRDYLFLKILVK